MQLQQFFILRIELNKMVEVQRSSPRTDWNVVALKNIRIAGNALKEYNVQFIELSHLKCATELYSSNEHNAAFSYIILRFRYIQGLILIGRNSSD